MFIYPHILNKNFLITRSTSTDYIGNTGITVIWGCKEEARQVSVRRSFTAAGSVSRDRTYEKTLIKVPSSPISYLSVTKLLKKLIQTMKHNWRIFHPPVHQVTRMLTSILQDAISIPSTQKAILQSSSWSDMLLNKLFPHSAKQNGGSYRQSRQLW